jgi:hypothetical protein
MTMRAVLLAAIASMGLVGCVGELDNGNMGPGPGSGSGVGSGTNPNPTPNSMAKKMFEQNVYPIVHNPGSNATSDCSGCHSVAGPIAPSAFVATDLTDAYATATSFQAVVGNFTPTTAGILTKIAAGHNARSYSAAEQQAITEWLAQEVVERASSGTTGTTGGETPGAATARLINQWSACMTDANFQQANMAQQWGQMETNNGSRCESCHATGGNGSFIASEVDTTFFDVVSTNRIYLSQYYTVDLSGGVANAKVMVNDLVFEGVSNAQPPHVEHPRFTWANSGAYNATHSFYTITAGGLGACAASNTKLNPPAQ